MMTWLQEYHLDILRYHPQNWRDMVKYLCTEPGLWVLLEYRVSAAVFNADLPRILKYLLRIPLLCWHWLITVITGIDLPCSAKIGAGLFLPHFGARVVHHEVTLGNHCSLAPGAVIGISGRGEKRGVPQIGDRVYIGPNAVIVGKITVGNEVLIGANSLVNRDLGDHCSVMGVPAVVISDRGSEGYLD